MGYSIEPRDRIFVKGYIFLSFAKNLGKNISKNISKDLSGKYRKKIFDHGKQTAGCHRCTKYSFKKSIAKNSRSN